MFSGCIKEEISTNGKNDFPFSKAELIEYVKTMDSDETEFKGVFIDKAIHALLSRSELNKLLFLRFQKRCTDKETLKRQEVIYELREEIFKSKSKNYIDKLNLKIESLMKENVTSQKVTEVCNYDSGCVFGSMGFICYDYPGNIEIVENVLLATEIVADRICRSGPGPWKPDCDNAYRALTPSSNARAICHPQYYQYWWFCYNFDYRMALAITWTSNGWTPGTINGFISFSDLPTGGKQYHINTRLGYKHEQALIAGWPPVSGEEVCQHDLFIASTYMSVAQRTDPRSIKELSKLGPCSESF